MTRVGFGACLIGVAAIFAIATGAAMANTTPRWVKHVQRYPGGISNGVRAYTDPGLKRAQSQARAREAFQAPAAPAAPGPRQNEKVNSAD